MNTLIWSNTFALDSVLSEQVGWNARMKNSQTMLRSKGKVTGANNLQSGSDQELCHKCLANGSWEFLPKIFCTLNGLETHRLVVQTRTYDVWQLWDDPETPVNKAGTKQKGLEHHRSHVAGHFDKRLSRTCGKSDLTRSNVADTSLVREPGRC